jgi:hypothetical protein
MLARIVALIERNRMWMTGKIFPGRKDCIRKRNRYINVIKVHYTQVWKYHMETPQWYSQYALRKNVGGKDSSFACWRK